ncbi:MAG TPA: UdgX family uracil-DNA binding protein [Dehalococcoidia bacterium]|nr:UdgX family uracil-DNA binding protein [Dehalococcoidia bacterium]
MTAKRDAGPYLPASRDLDSLRNAIAGCRGCDLYQNATQAVFGAGVGGALVLVGEQPGDQEDQQGEPFVGPAGGVLERAIADGGLTRGDVYLTNAVKHFKWTPRGKRRIHDTPRASEVRACRPWLAAELEAVKPALIVCLGATAVHSLLGASVRVLANRGKVLEGDYGPCLVTVHPSSILRVEGSDERDAAYEAFAADIGRAVEFWRRQPAALKRS